MKLPHQGVAAKIINTMLKDDTTQRPLKNLLDNATGQAREHFKNRDRVVQNELPITGTAGALGVIAQHGEVVARAHSGVASFVTPTGEPLPEPAQEPITDQHLWDVASITKTVVTVAALTLVDQQILDLNARVTDYLPEFAVAENTREKDEPRQNITLRHLMTHTAGLQAVSEPWTVPGGRAERAQYILKLPLENKPGEVHVYSCVGFMILGFAIERVTGKSLPDIIATNVTEPLGMNSTTYTPNPDAPIVATEFQEKFGRGLVRGEVHDEAAWFLGTSGNAGLFSNADDLLRFGEEIRTGSHGVLSEKSRALLTEGTLRPDQISRVGYDQAIGFRLGQELFMGSPDKHLLGHTGFTGPSLVIDPDHGRVSVLLTNSVHPQRGTFDVNPLRRQVHMLGR